MKLAILGSGAWGTALAISLSERHGVSLWGRDAAHIEAIKVGRENQRYLPGVLLPAQVSPLGDFSAAIIDADLVLAVLPTNALRQTVRALKAAGCRAPLVWACKGFEQGSARLPHQIVKEELGDRTQCGVLSGPSFAKEVAEGKPAALTLASGDEHFALRTARELHGSRLRVYSSNDVAGVELGGALKNVIAIAAGVSDGLGLGNNARSALITRGLAEIARVGVKLQGQPETFTGLTGVGDLVLTCTSDLSRNRRVGLALARGLLLADFLAQLGHVAEGVTTAPEVARVAAMLNVEMPITETVCALLSGRVSAAAAVDGLMRRDPRAE
jgi:glycerol-3-phosphate dehydrogenase (NAD(P)+)